MTYHRKETQLFSNEIMNDAKLHEWLRSVDQFNTTDRLREEAESWNF